MRIREANKLLRLAGFQLIRQKSHSIWTHPDGRTVSLPLGHGNLYGNMAHKVRQYVKGDNTSYQRKENDSR